MSQYQHLSNPDPEFSARWQPRPPLVLNLAEINKMRQGFKMFAIAPYLKYWEERLPQLPAESLYKVQDHEVPVEGGAIRARAVVPTAEDDQATFPLLVWLHSGGWMNGDIDMDDAWLRTVCVELGISILNVEYRLLPEHPWPAALDDSYAAVKWAADHADILGASLAKGFIVAGASSGANTAVAIVHRARSDPFFEAKKITGHALQIPMLMHPDAYPDQWKPELLSMEQNKDAPAVNKSAIEGLCKLTQASPTDPRFSVLLAPHEGVPPLYLQVCGLDPLRDEGFLYEKLLQEKNTKTKSDVCSGVPHNFQLSMPDIGQAVKFDRDFRDGVKWLLANPA
ncbi:hypothetical protein OE88DRAFT_1656349 [Heliocybe sulcata]|uniref:Alpha/beta hydrolase fold-3 domain-containing protein n=1 Tax=Heliocybe sulcata TaxID=5364 RepID=A0A5C3NGV5_9AGAM|nr:hypothetical protein OE88DRAFT_1656349 [Heliocybe sulcata]